MNLECCYIYVSLLSCPSITFFAPGYHDLHGLNHSSLNCGSPHNILSKCLLLNSNSAFRPEDDLTLCCRLQEWMGRATEERAPKPQPESLKSTNTSVCKDGEQQNSSREKQNWENHLGKHFGNEIFHSSTVWNGEKRNNPSVYQQCDGQTKSLYIYKTHNYAMVKINEPQLHTSTYVHQKTSCWMQTSSHTRELRVDSISM